MKIFPVLFLPFIYKKKIYACFCVRVFSFNCDILSFHVYSNIIDFMAFCLKFNMLAWALFDPNTLPWLCLMRGKYKFRIKFLLHGLSYVNCDVTLCSILLDGQKKNWEKRVHSAWCVNIPTRKKDVEMYFCSVNRFMWAVCYLKIPIVFVSSITVLIRLTKQNLRRTQKTQ